MRHPDTNNSSCKNTCPWMILPKILTFFHPEFQLSTKYCWVLIMLQSDTPCLRYLLCFFRLPFALCWEAPDYLRGYLKSWLCETRTRREAFGHWHLAGNRRAVLQQDSRRNPHSCWLCTVPFITWQRPDHRTYTCCQVTCEVLLY